MYAATAELQKTTGYHNVSRERVRVGEGGWEGGREGERDLCEESYPQPSTTCNLLNPTLPSSCSDF